MEALKKTATVIGMIILASLRLYAENVSAQSQMGESRIGCIVRQDGLYKFVSAQQKTAPTTKIAGQVIAGSCVTGQPGAIPASVYAA